MIAILTPVLPTALPLTISMAAPTEDADTFGAALLSVTPPSVAPAPPMPTQPKEPAMLPELMAALMLIVAAPPVGRGDVAEAAERFDPDDEAEALTVPVAAPLVMITANAVIEPRSADPRRVAGTQAPQHERSEVSLPITMGEMVEKAATSMREAVPIVDQVALPRAIAVTAAPAADTAPIERQLDLARDSLWLDNLARDIVAAGEGGGRLSFKLSPPTLGALDVSLAPGERGLAVAMTASTEDAAQIIGAGTARLVEDLRAQGLRIASADVSTGTSHSHDRHHRSPAPSPFIETGFAVDDIINPHQVQPPGRFA